MNHLEDAGGQRRFLVILMSVLSEEEEDENEMTETDEQQCMRLQENDPTLSEVTIISLNNNNARRYGEALQHNTVVNKLTIWHASQLTLDDDDNNVDLLLQFIETSRSLETFHWIRNDDNVRVSRRFLLAVSRSTSMKDLSLSNMTIPADSLEYLFNHTQSLTKLTMSSRISIEGAFVALSRNTSIEELTIYGDVDSVWIKVLDHVGPQPNIKRLFIYGGLRLVNMSVPLSKSIQRFLEASATLQSIEFANYIFDAFTFEPIAAGLKQSQSLKKIRLFFCTFDYESRMLFQSVFQCPASNIQTLNITGRTDFDTPVSTVLSEIIALKSNTSKLSEIKLCLETYSNGFDMAALLGPLEEDSTLESLDLRSIDTTKGVNELFSSIPRLRGLKEITCSFSYTQNTDENKRLLKKAVRPNCSLEKVCCVDFPDGNLQSYCDRNITVPQLIADPDAVPISVWPNILQSQLAYEYKHDSQFRSLMALGDIMGQQKSRKRSPPVSGAGPL
jgi:hypothetical protein